MPVKARKEEVKAEKQVSAIKGRIADPDAVKYQSPTFTLKDIRDAVPSHCFKRNTLTSLSHVAKDLAMAGSLFYLASWISSAPIYAQLPLWLAYWWCQGIVCTGLWVLAHECGHMSFSDFRSVNHTVGFILHSFLLVPFFSWKYTHSKHHKGTNHMEKDQVFVPATRRRVEKRNGLPITQEKVDSLYNGKELLEDAPLMNLVNVILMLLVGWPLYLLKNSTSQKHEKWVSHFFPSAPIFDAKEYRGVVISNVGFFFMVGFLAKMISIFGGWSVFKFYGIPYLLVNMWLVLITFLQHTDPRCPRYRGDEWNFMKGALATVDRDFGILNHFFHHITDTHVAHHLFSTMPFYHAIEATRHVKEFLGEYYLYENGNFWVAALDCYSRCKFVENEGELLWFKY
jgi:omega-6 fatty acid desaturase / acyl-lipid omega-6 desaturase (Delta-12 desaturase)